VDFIKVSHHGSQNGTPDENILDEFAPGSKKSRHAVISTWTDTYSGIPHQPTSVKLGRRCTLHSILDDKSTPYIDTFFTPA
jgi:hypothetical protein